MRKLKGQVAVEFIFSVGCFFSMTVFILEVGLLGLARQKALSLARFGTALQSCNLLDEEVIQSQISNYSREMAASQRINFECEWGRTAEIPGSNFYQLMKTKVRYEIGRLTGRVAPSWFQGEEIMVEQKAPLED